ncbi:MAG: hypothetical protein JOZ52_00325 [Acidobacteria bacterium]|nr:hypothetical protein [Acidobacteriota bacterium]
MKKLAALLLCIALTSIAYGRNPVAASSRTEWNISPSFKFDTLCFLNALTGDEFYRRYYANEYASFAPRLTPAARAALASLKRKLKDENKNIISAFLCLYFSATEDQTLDDMLRTLGDSRLMKRNLQETVYYSKDGWKLFESVRDELKTIFTFMKAIEFEAYWQRNILPKIERRIAEVKSGLQDYDVVSEVEMHLGQPLASNKITIYLLYYSQPHGIKITGTRFICDMTYPLKILVQNAVHEMMHPPYDLKRDRELSRALEGLQADRFLMDKIRNHNPSFGYNSFEGYVEEDCVRALDQLIGERFKIAVDARQRWKDEDEGMHVLAVALYSLMKQESYNSRKELFRDFLLRVIRSGKLKAGNVKPLYDAFYRV